MYFRACCAFTYKTAFNLNWPALHPYMGERNPGGPHGAFTSERKGQTAMLNLFRGRRLASGLSIVLPTVLLLGGCAASTTVLSSANPSRASPDDWADYETLPVDVHGVVPGRSKAELAALFPPYNAPQYAAVGALPAASSGRRMVLYVNPAPTMPTNDLCDGRQHIQRGPQQGESAYVVGALCDGPKVISTASAYILDKDQTPQGLAYNFRMIRYQLYQSLFPGANDPMRYYN
jgi:hypothetical protein